MRATLVLLFAVCAAGAAGKDEPCHVELNSVSRSAVTAGGEFSLYGRWGEERGARRPAINPGGGRDPEVLSWSETVVRLRVPPGLAPGMYKTGVYCGGGSSFSSGFASIEVLAPGAVEPPESPEPAELTPAPAPASSEPDAAGLEKFEKEWRGRGRAAAKRVWFKRRSFRVLGDAGVSDEILRQVADSVRSQLDEFGARSFSVEAEPARAAGAFKSCSREGVLDRPCFSTAVAAWRDGAAGRGRGVLVFVTNSAIGRLPRDLGNGVTSGPPAGEAVLKDGALIISEYYRRKNQRAGDEEFSRQGRDHTVRHELGHILGLPHHQDIANPGFAEPPRCTACGHQGAGWHKPGHSECMMFCGANDDAWFHRLTFGESFGFCAKCAAAARALVQGLEGR